MATIEGNIQQVHARIAAACRTALRPVQSVTLLVVSKTFTARCVRDAFTAGEHQFGENYVQEGIDKIDQLSDIRDQLQWHLIGPLQSNKTRVVAQHFDWVHSVDRFKTAQRLSDQRPHHLPPLQICLQVNVSGETSKSGFAPHELPQAAQQIASLPRLELRGLMSIPEPSSSLTVQRASHRSLRLLLEQLKADGLTLDTLSMGMSHDYALAIEEGSDIIRIGEGIFGPRRK